MTAHMIGQAFSLMAAITWAFGVVLFKRSGEHVPPLALNLFKNVIGITLLAITLVVMGEGFDTLRQYDIGDIYILIISGVLGIVVADTIFFHSLNLVGVGIISIVDCTYSPFTILFSYLMLSEKLTAAHYVGGFLILLGVFISSRHAPPSNRTRGQIALGVFLGTLAMGLMAVGIVFAKPVLDMQGFPLIWATMIRMFFGTLALAVWAAVSTRRREYWRTFRPSSVWKMSVPASVLGAYMAMIFWVAGFKYTYASVAAILNQTSVVFSLLLATFLLKEPLTRRKLVSVILALTGVAVMLSFGK